MQKREKTGRTNEFFCISGYMKNKCKNSGSQESSKSTICSRPNTAHANPACDKNAEAYYVCGDAVKGYPFVAPNDNNLTLNAINWCISKSLRICSNHDLHRLAAQVAPHSNDSCQSKRSCFPLWKITI
ncbi:hypothetical protein HYC85_008665 [Camellia sinensis]|uniref:Uncharacterized protein n=1 Tax=Camellia sinensis TaxID=4442 RepID=A0A7J7HT27_CAMSI|nr:hypothetical protein HYC85_008665 [Camellia sinensis]